MNGVMATAVSGLTASSMWMDAIASNIANARDESSVPSTSPSQPVSSASGNFQPVSVAIAAVVGGGVTSRIVPSLPSYTEVYDPSTTFANAQGLAALPAVDLAGQFVDMTRATASYRANIAVIKAAEKMDKTTLDLLA